MLKTNSLVLRPRSELGGARTPSDRRRLCPTSKRLLEDAESHEILGFATWWTCASPGWRFWLGRPRCTVHEELDDSLLFAMRPARFFRKSWTVLDADERTVGTVMKEWILDYDRRLLAQSWHTLEQRSHVVFRAPRGGELARLQPQETSWRLDFRAEAEGDPFLKMLLLAASLVFADTAD